MIKPRYCFDNCPLGRSAGFCRDYLPEGARLGFLISMPFREDAATGRSLASPGARHLFERLLSGCSLLAEEVARFYVLRCHPGSYPSGRTRFTAESACRSFDESIRRFNPEIFYVTYGTKQILAQKPFFRLAKDDIARAYDLGESQNKRVLILFGDEPLHLLWSGQGLGSRHWRGHWWYGSWPYSAGVLAPARTAPEVRSVSSSRRPNRGAPATQLRLL